WVFTASARGRLGAPVVGLLTAGAFLVVGIWGAESWRQSRLWRDSETLWRWAVDVDPDCALCHNNLGSVILETPPYSPLRASLAERHFREAIRLHPERPNPYHNLGAALAVQKRYPEAEAAFRAFIEKYPETPAGRGSLGVLLIEQKRYAEAVPVLRAALSMIPNSRELKIALATALRARAQEMTGSEQRQDAAALAQEARTLEAEAQRSTTSAR
ncbi:MAG TPA: tetratricopeptide repeat protein, partial [Methylomirabilota bacterium]|nr:tetratricopeptide repeat protein [Methylomirabilota bacterium]